MPPKVNVSYNLKLLVFFTTYFVQFLQGTKLTVTRGFCVEKVQKKNSLRTKPFRPIGFAESCEKFRFFPYWYKLIVVSTRLKQEQKTF